MASRECPHCHNPVELRLLAGGFCVYYLHLEKPSSPGLSVEKKAWCVGSGESVKEGL